MGSRPSDPDAYRQWRSARRNTARRHHPDVGGDREEYIERMREVDRQYGVDDAPTQPGGVSGSASGRAHLVGRAVRRARRRARQRLRRVRGQLPRRMPGSRRYFDL